MSVVIAFPSGAGTANMIQQAEVSASVLEPESRSKQLP